MTLVREPDAGKSQVRFDERKVKTEHGMRLLSHRRGNPETDVCRSFRHRITFRLYTTGPSIDGFQGALAGSRPFAVLLQAYGLARANSNPARVVCFRSVPRH